jgi:alginate O-acetyltransferase complex protein AlgJ
MKTSGERQFSGTGVGAQAEDSEGTVLVAPVPQQRPGSPFRPERLKSAATVFLCGLFLVLLWMPAFDSAFKLDNSPIPIENRAPAKLPVWGTGAQGVKGYLAGLEAYFNDHFGFRNLFIRTHGFFLRKVFGQGSVEVLIGRDQWLFYAGNRAIDCHMGVKLLSARQLNEWQALLEKRRDWLAERGIKYLFVLTPNKESIYPEYLPEWAHKEGAVTQLDQLLAHLRAHSTVEILDLRPAMIEARKNGRIYLITDTHWNHLGAFAGYRAIIQTLARQLPGMEPLGMDAFESSVSQRPGGDLARMLAQEQAMRERDFVTLTPRSELPKLEVKSDPSILPREWLPEEQPVFVENSNQKYTAVVFRDSFAEYLIPFLGHNFKRIVFIWQRPWDLKVIEHEKPNVVIDEMLERYLDWPIASQ